MQTENTPARIRRAATAALSRRQLLASLAAVPAIGAALAACGDRTRSDAGAAPGGSAPGTAPDAGPGTGSGAVPTTTIVATHTELTYDSSADAVVVRVGHEGGFVPVEHDFARQPAFLLAGDGRAFTPAPTTMQHPGPLVSPYSVRVVSPDGVRAILALAASKGLLGEIPDYDSERSMQVADAPDTVVTLAAGGATYRHSAYALGLGDPGAEAEETPARRALQEFVQAVSALDTVVPAGSASVESAYVPATYRIKAMPVEPSTIVDTAPAAEPPETTAGWAPFPFPVVDWPGEAGVTLADSGTCALVPAGAVAELFAAANTETRFREGEAVWSLAVAAVIPGDQRCAT